MPLTSVQQNFLARANLPVALSNEAEAQREIAEAALNWFNVQLAGINVNNDAHDRLVRACEKADG